MPTVRTLSMKRNWLAFALALGLLTQTGLTGFGSGTPASPHASLSRQLATQTSHGTALSNNQRGAQLVVTNHSGHRTFGLASKPTGTRPSFPDFLLETRRRSPRPAGNVAGPLCGRSPPQISL
jgi:hypothetical protein